MSSAKENPPQIDSLDLSSRARAYQPTQAFEFNCGLVFDSKLSSQASPSSAIQIVSILELEYLDKYKIIAPTQLNYNLLNTIKFQIESFSTE